MDETEDKVMQLLDDLKEKYGKFLDDTASEAGDGSGLHFDLTSGNIINGNEIYIEAFYLKPEAQGKGIGKKMVTALKELSDEIGVPITLLDKTLESAYSASFWKSMGFDIDDDTSAGFYNYEGDPSSSRFARESLQFEPFTSDDVAEVTNTSDDVAEVTNDFVYKKFAEKQRTADNVIFRELDDGTIELLVIKRKRGPHRSLYALPGGIVDNEIINDESIIRSIIDRPSFKKTSGVHKAIENYRLNNKELPGDNLKFAAEALREALEETGLTIEDIVNSAELDVKYNRYDWDARAAQGVDVGGIVLNVNTDWTPKAGDDALKTEWVKLQDVADGKVQLAFGHAEFVKEGFEKFYDNNIFEQTNPKNTFYGIYVSNNNPENIIKKLDDVSKQNAQRNINIIKESNPIRKAAGQPEIDITNKTVIDRQNNKLLDSILRMNEVPFKGKTALASELLKPEVIMNHILQPITDQRNGSSVWDVDYNINESSFKNPRHGKSLTYGDPSFEHRQTWQFKEFTEQKQQNIKRQVQRELVENYRSFLTSLQTQGMSYLLLRHHFL